MKDRKNVFPAVFAAVMLLCVLIWFALVPMRAVLRFQQDDLALSLETSQGRERKQQYEYEKVTQDLPATRQELAELQPKTDAAVAEVTELKALRKELRARLRELQAQQDAASGEEAAP